MIVTLLLLLLSNVFIVFIFWVNVYRKEGPASPLFVVLLFYLFNYPLRAMMLFAAIGTNLEFTFKSWAWGFSQSEICLSLFYATLFTVCMVMTYSLLIARRRFGVNHYEHPSRVSGLTTGWQKGMFGCLIFGYMLSFVYKLFVGDLFSLYESLEDLKHSLFFNLIGLVQYLKWFFIAFAFLRIQRDKSLKIIILVVTLIGTVIIASLVSTAKGDLVTLSLLWAICFWLVRGRLPKLTLLLAAVVVIGFSFYSAAARQYDYAGVRSVEGTGYFESLKGTADIVTTKYREDLVLLQEQVGKVFSRFNGMDSLILCQRQNTFLEDGPYVAGSLVELGNIIPRFVWPSRPHLSFNHHTTQAVWGMSVYYFLEMPIGRIGESFYVLNWAGLLYAIFYAFLWSWIYRTFMLRSQNDLETAFYLGLVCVLVMPDAYMVYNWKGVVVMMVGYVFLVSGRFLGTKKRKNLGSTLLPTREKRL